ncbi:hypothetical protein K6W36_09435 [Acetobacter senegalensis]|uniref:hypothetical protein n=1 Tax=Acetobacter senegalensis TaxID=446692 RepID=UPI001EDAC865|nr:hypothetical protein [Acetobacter senegalensis]MCG4260805.1 hypothetical protein [Acetobacter senegalensis]
MKVRDHLFSAVILAGLLSHPALAQQTEQGSVGCAQLTQAAADAINQRVQANDVYEKQPESVGALSCLDGFLHGQGLNVITSGLDPTSLIQNLESQLGSQICDAAQSAWGNAMGGTQCSLSLSGINLGLGFGNVGSGTMCPSLNFGGGGPPIASGGFGTNSGSRGLYVESNPLLPAGYSANSVMDGVF